MPKDPAAHAKTVSAYLPDFVARRIIDIDVNQLRRLGVKHLCLDLDLTIRRLGAKTLDDEIVSFLVGLKETKIFESINLLTNNKRDLARLCQPLGINVFQPFRQNGRTIRKPKRQFFERVTRQLKAKPLQFVMIGDKIFSDIAGANRAGMYTVLVRPYGKDAWYDRLLLTRYREKLFIFAAHWAVSRSKRRKNRSNPKPH